MVSTGILIRYSLPPRSGGDAIWSLTRHDWGGFHYYLSIAFLLLIASHLVTHIKFIKTVITGKATNEKNFRIAFGLLGLIALILFAFAPVTSPVTEIDRGFQHRFQNHPL